MRLRTFDGFFPLRISGSSSANRNNRRASGAVENAAAVEIKKEGLRQYSLDDFHELLGKACAKDAPAFPHLPQPRRRRLTFHMTAVLISFSGVERPLKAQDITPLSRLL